MAQTEPVRVQRHGRDVAVVLPPEEFRRLAEAALGKASPAVERLHAESAMRWAGVYAALAITPALPCQALPFPPRHPRA